MKAGRLDRRITVEKLVSGQDEYGQPIDSWTTHAAMWAEAHETAMPEITGGIVSRGRQDIQIELARTRTSFTVRYRTDITAKMRIVHEGAIHQIVSVHHTDGRDRATVLVAERG